MIKIKLQNRMRAETYNNRLKHSTTKGGAFNERSAPSPELVSAAARFPTPGAALDLGAGIGNETRYLLSKGWKVLAIDGSPGSVVALKKRISGCSTLLTTSAIDFSDMKLPSDTFDLVNARQSLPFAEPTTFDDFIRNIAKSMKANGVLTADFFAPDDFRILNGGARTSHQREDLTRSLGRHFFEVQVKEYRSASPKGPWHMWQVLAKKR